MSPASFATVLKDYQQELDLFFDARSGAVLEKQRDDGTPGFLFTEVTGYALLDFLLLHSLTGRTEHMARARKAADWLIAEAMHPCGGVRTRFYFDRDGDERLQDMSFSGAKLFSFDTGICLRGMVAFYSAVREPKYLDAARRMGEHLLHVTDDRGAVAAVYDARGGQGEPEIPARWSRRSGAYHAKVAEALADLHAATRESRWANGAERICRFGLATQHPRGNYRTSEKLTELHPHCYAAEGMLHTGIVLNVPEFVHSSRQATAWAMEQAHEGGVPQSFDYETSEPVAKGSRTDAVAQVLALAADHADAGQLDADEPRLRMLAEYLVGMKRRQRPRIFRYGSYERKIAGRTSAQTISYWTNMFCMRALAAYYSGLVRRRTCVVIPAAGKGKRCWPISCETRPKPLSYAFLGDRSLLQETIRRFTGGQFLAPRQIFIACTEASRAEVQAQAAEEGIPPENVIAQEMQAGTVYAVSDAMKHMPQDTELVIATMADNVIAPAENYRGAALAALYTARRHNCIVSVGKAVDTQAKRDARFGHMVIREQGRTEFAAWRVEQFVEKPQPEQFEQLQAARGQDGRIAWECGTVVFRPEYFRKIQPRGGRGGLATDILARAGAWPTEPAPRVQAAVAVMSDDTRFDDFGVPGENLWKHFQAHSTQGSTGNVILGRRAQVRALACRGNLILADELPMQLYGLRDQLVIDDAASNATVIMPLSEVEHLSVLHDLLQANGRYQAFTVGGQAARSAPPLLFAENSPETQIRSTHGLAFAYKCAGRLVIERSSARLRATNASYPALEEVDFENLCARQEDDPRLVEHLVAVTALAEALVERALPLGQWAWNLLHLSCLYHDFGGCLREDLVQHEQEMVRSFRRVSRLDRRWLDSRVANAMMARCGAAAEGNGEGMLDDDANSAAEFVRRREVRDASLRDAVVLLLSAQNNPDVFQAFRAAAGSLGFPASSEELNTAYGALKAAEVLCNGRWRWKRAMQAPADGRLLLHNRGPVEDHAFLTAFLASQLQRAAIEPGPIVQRVADLLTAGASPFSGILEELSESADLPCDRLFAYLLTSEKPERSQLDAMIEQAVERICGVDDGAYDYQWRQLQDLPRNMAAVMPCCPRITPRAVEMAEACIERARGEFHEPLRARDLLPPREGAAATSGRRQLAAGAR